MSHTNWKRLALYAVTEDYTSCGNTFKTTETWRYDVDPTSDTIVTPWYVKNFPVTVKWNYTAGDRFTMLIYDVGYKVSHGVYVNILGNDMMTATVMVQSFKLCNKKAIDIEFHLLVC
jgi:hypothetical protein